LRLSFARLAFSIAFLKIMSVAFVVALISFLGVSGFCFWSVF